MLWRLYPWQYLSPRCKYQGLCLCHGGRADYVGELESVAESTLSALHPFGKWASDQVSFDCPNQFVLHFWSDLSGPFNLCALLIDLAQLGKEWRPHDHSNSSLHGTASMKSLIGGFTWVALYVVALAFVGIDQAAINANLASYEPGEVKELLSKLVNFVLNISGVLFVFFSIIAYLQNRKLRTIEMELDGISKSLAAGQRISPAVVSQSSELPRER